MHAPMVFRISVAITTITTIATFALFPAPHDSSARATSVGPQVAQPDLAGQALQARLQSPAGLRL